MIQLVENNKQSQTLLELIDGQQRITTLYILCQILNSDKNDVPFPELSFAIRPEVNKFLAKLKESNYHKEPLDGMNGNTSLKGLELMQDAATTMISFFRDQKIDKRKFAQYVHENVKIVFTEIPAQTDLNKLFEVINNRGVQLQHHEILKARMLKVLEKNDRGRYAVLWEACADMSNYVEKSLLANLRGASHTESRNKIIQLFDSKLTKHDEELLAKAASVLVQLSNNHDNQDKSQQLSEILNNSQNNQEDSSKDRTDNSKAGKETGSVRSIIGFPLLLLHTLRIWLYQHNKKDIERISDNNLLRTFDVHFFNGVEEKDKADKDKEDNVKSFISLLWEIRYLFDKHIIKWVTDDNGTEVHSINKIQLVKEQKKPAQLTRSQNSDTHRGFALLQSMLYHSQDITKQYWLTPLLYYIHSNHSNTEQYYDFLRHFEMYLLGSKAKERMSMVELTHCFMEAPYMKDELIHKDELEGKKGVDFHRYWFYKLEFVLWYLSEQKENQLKHDYRWKQFRFTAKNSVEHISPQKPREGGDTVSEDFRDSFGNLALVTRSVNSEYSNLPFNEKQQRFKNNNKEKVDSLKMDLIYDHQKWNDEAVKEHQKQMIQYFDDYKETLKCP